MLDIGWSELAVIAAVAIIVIGPKDLPLALKAVGQWVAKARGLAREFQGSVDEMIREAERAAEVDKLKKEVADATSQLDVTKELEATKAEIERSIDMPPIEVDPLKDPLPEKPVESVAAPPPDAPVMPLPSTMIEAPPAEEPQPAEPANQQVPAEQVASEPPPPPPQRVAGGQA